jgi:KUP system potassium uptake protein
MEFYLYFCYTAIWDQASWEIFCSNDVNWFSMLGILGNSNCATSRVFKAINPYYAYQLLRIHPDGFFVLGLCFVCTTGAEALYSDMGHCGRKYSISWIL